MEATQIKDDFQAIRQAIEERRCSCCPVGVRKTKEAIVVNVARVDREVAQ